jgi:putative transposase
MALLTDHFSAASLIFIFIWCILPLVSRVLHRKKIIHFPVKTRNTFRIVGGKYNNKGKLNHTTYDCKYHIVWIPKYREKAIYGQLRKYLGEVFRDLALQRESEILEGHLLGDHVHIWMGWVFQPIGCT